MCVPPAHFRVSQRPTRTLHRLGTQLRQSRVCAKLLTKLLSKTHDKYMANIPKDIEDMNQAAAAIDNEGSGSEVHALKAYV